MLQRKLLATLLATALLLSTGLPAFAVPAQEEAEPPSVISVVISWLTKSLGLEIVTEPEAKLGIYINPDGLEGSSDPDDDSSPTTVTSSGDEEPDDELGIAINPAG